MEADQDRLNAKLRGATVIDLDAAREERNRGSKSFTAFVDGAVKTAAQNWMILFALFLAFWFLKRAR